MRERQRDGKIVCERERERAHFLISSTRRTSIMGRRRFQCDYIFLDKSEGGDGLQNEMWQNFLVPPNKFGALAKL